MLTIKRSNLFNYRRSLPCDHSRKRPALFTTTIVKPRLNCDLNLVMKSSRKRPRPLLGLPKWSFPLLLSSRKRPLSLIHVNQHLNETAHRANDSLIKILGLFWSKNLDVKYSCVFIRNKDTHRILIYHVFSLRTIDALLKLS